MGGGKGGASVAPIYTPPASAPVVEQATMVENITPLEEQKKKIKAVKEGALSLSIPLGLPGDKGKV